MLHQIARILIIGLSGLTFATAVTAGDTTKKPARDPNEKVCEDIGVVGSRLAVKRICATRAEWAERRKQDRQDIERVQSLSGAGCGYKLPGGGGHQGPGC